MIKPYQLCQLVLLLVSFAFAQSAFSQSEATAEYSVTFTGNWTLSSTPGGVVGGAHFTTIAGGKHNSSVSFWRSGESATSGLESLAELGATGGFLNEIRASSHTDAAFSSSVGPGGTGTSTFTLNMKRTHPLVTLASMIGPSPDWFVGLSGYSLLDSSSNWVSSTTVNLYPYDAGTEDGENFSLSNPATSPQGVITSIRGVGKFSNEPMATISFTRQDTPPPSAPTISAIKRPSSANEHTNSDSVTWLVTFSEAVRNVSADDFIVYGTTATVTSVSLDSGSTTRYQVVVSGGDLANLNGTISLGLSILQNITNNTNVALSTTLPLDSATYTIDNIVPRVTSVSPSTADESPFTVFISFSESLRASSFADAGDVTSNEAEVSAPSAFGASYQVTVTPNSPSQATDITLTIPAGAATDVAGNRSSGYEAVIEYEPAIVSTPPVVNSVDAITSDGLYHMGEEIEVGVTFSDSVIVTGSPSLVLQFDARTRNAPYDRGSGSNSLVFSYTLAGGDTASDLDYVSTQALVLAGGSIIGTNGALADLTLPAPGQSGSLSQTSNIRTSGRQDAMPSFGTQDINDQVLMMNQRVDSLQLPFASGGDLPLRYVLEPMLPPGLELDTERHEISGTPTEVFDETTFTWSVTDVDGDTVSLTFTIMILPRLTLQFPRSASIQDQVLLQNDAIDPIELPLARGGVGDLSYSLVPTLPAGLTLSLEARQITGTPTEVLDQTTFTWRVEDQEGSTAELTFELTVLEDFHPVFDLDLAVIDQTFIQDSAITPFTLPKASNGNGQLTYELESELPAGLALDVASFKISGTPSIPSTRATFNWTATDEDGDSATFSFYITVVEDAMPSFTEDAAIAEREFISDSAIEPFSLPVAMGGNGELRHRLSPDLPSGLKLDLTSFEISGTPIQASPRTQFTWTVQDVDGNSNSLSFYVTVIQDALPVFDEYVADKEFTERTAIDAFTLPRASGGNGQLSYELTPQLPNGINLELATASITGTPTEVIEETTFSWIAKDVDGDTAELTFNITVLPRIPLHFPTSAVIPDQIVLQNDAIATIELPSAMGGFGEFTYSLLPDLPAGLTLNLEARQITGTPTAVLGETTFTWRVIDEDGERAELTFAMTVLEDLQPVFDPDLSNVEFVFTQNSPITPFILPSASSGNGQLTHTLESELPKGLVIDETSFEISGIPSTPQRRTVLEWTATDADGDSATFSFYITVLEDLMPSFPQTADISDREFITDSAIMPFSLPAAMGGNGSLHYILSPDLPSGLSLDPSSFEIRGTPTSAQERTRFMWTVSDEDGDSIALAFHLTVIQDTQPVFSLQIDDKVFVMGTPIESFTLPEASGGNGQLTYELTPQLGNGLSVDAETASISGTPIAEAATSTYTWSVTDVDGDTVSQTFNITVNPAQPEVVGSLANVQLTVGGSSRTVDASTAIEGRVDSWQVAASNTDVASVSSSTSGVLTLAPRFEGQTSVTVTASNVTGLVSISFSVNVVTASVENDQIDSALSLKAGALLSGAMNVFKRRTHSHGNSAASNGASSLWLDSEWTQRETNWPRQPDFSSKLFTNPSAHVASSLNQPQSLAFGNDLVPLNFSHTSTSWSVWGALDLQNFSTDTNGNAIDGSLSSMYVGADLAVNKNVFAGLAFARHAGSSSYEFMSSDAEGSAEIDTTLNGIYPYLQMGDGNRYSMFLVGGIGSGDSQIDRRHAIGTDQDVDTDMTLFAGGFDYVVLKRANLDFAIVGDAGVATLTTDADSGVLAGREASSSKSSIGGSVSFNPRMEAGSMVTSVDIRLATGAEDDESATGFELGANLNFFGDHIDFMLDGRTTSRSADVDVQRSSISARLRYKAKPDESGLTIAVSPSWGDSSLLNLSERFGPTMQANGYRSFISNDYRSIEGEVSYGFRTNSETALLKPRLAWQGIGSEETILKLGTSWDLRQTTKAGLLFRFDLLRTLKGQDQPRYGLSANVHLRL